MATISRRELRNNVAEVLRRAGAGEECTITGGAGPAMSKGAIGSSWLAELNFGTLVARDPDARSPTSAAVACPLSAVGMQCGWVEAVRPHSRGHDVS